MNPSGVAGRIPALRRIGLDLDNTIVDYADLIREEIGALGILDAVPAGDKRAARDALREAPEGESHWIRLQARIYGSRMEGAVPFPGAVQFIARAKAAGIGLAIVSHKTEFAAADPGGRGPNLRAAAYKWLVAHGVVGPLGIEPEAVYFEATRSAKAVRIAGLRLEVFIDDLLEVFADPAFPPGVERWLFAPEPPAGEAGVDRVFSTWDAISRAVFESDAKRDDDKSDAKHGR